MVYLNQALNRMRDLIADDMDDGQTGTNSTPSQDDQTSLIAPLADTKNALTVIKSDKIIKVTHTVLFTEAVSETLTEWEIRMNSASATRTITNNIAKDVNHQVDHIHTTAITQY